MMLWGNAGTAKTNRGAQELGPGNSVIGARRPQKNFPSCTSLDFSTLLLITTPLLVLSALALL